MYFQQCLGLRLITTVTMLFIKICSIQFT
ncbi:hypothetical protein lerEdw1_002051, partial [Lerista edwardsae]